VLALEGLWHWVSSQDFPDTLPADDKIGLGSGAGAGHPPQYPYNWATSEPLTHNGCLRSQDKNGLATLSTLAPWLFTLWLVPHGVGAIQSAEIHQTEGGTPEIAQANRGRSSEPLPLPEGCAGVQGAENTQKWQSGGWLYRCTPQLQSSKLQLTEGPVPEKALQGQQGVLSRALQTSTPDIARSRCQHPTATH